MLRSSDRAKADRLRKRNRNRFISGLEQLEGRALLASLYVNAANLTGTEDGSPSHPYRQIQTAINHTAPTGDVVNVAPGVYAENVNINHSIQLLGPNAGINPNSGSRGAEATLLPPTNNPDASVVILVTASNVTIDGLTIDGHNANLPTGTLLNGISSNAGTGIGNVDNLGHLTFVTGLNVVNNVIQNFTLFGVLADADNLTSSPAKVSTGNAIRNNKVDNLPLVSPNPGRGISIEHNFYADVTGNVVTRAGTGIQAIFMLDRDPTGAVSSISGNEVHAYNLGINLWTIDSEIPAFSVANNSVFAQSGPYATPTNVGIKLERVLHSTGVSVQNNNSTGNHIGIQLQYITASPITPVSGGTLSGNDYGVFITNSNPVPGDVPPKNVLGSIAGVSIRDARIAALFVEDSLANPAAGVTLNVDAATTLTGNARGALLSGPKATLVESVKPTLALTATPPPQTSETSATFGFNVADNISSIGDLLVQYSLDGGALASATSPVSLSGLALGAHTFLLRAADQAGNFQTTSYQWTITAAQQTPGKPSLDPTSDTGSSNTDGITKNTTPTLVGTAPANSLVTLFADNIEFGSTVADSSGNWSFTVGGPGSLIAGAPDGSYTIAVTAKNAADPTSLPSAPFAVVVDTVNPTAAFTSTPPAQTSSTSASFAFTASDDYSAAGNLLVQYSLDGGALTSATSPINLSGLGLGSHTLLLKVTDQAGNASSISYPWTVGQATPGTTPTPGKPSLDADSDTGASKTDGITGDNTPTFLGTAPANSVVTLFAGSTQLGTTVANSSGSWSFTVGGPGSTLASLPDGPYAITAKAQTATATISQPSAALAIVIDTTAPAVTIGASPNVIQPPDNRTVQVTVSGKVSDALAGPGTNLSYTVSDSYGQVSLSGSLTLGAGGDYSFTVPLPATVTGLSVARSFTISVTGLDAAGNSKTVSTVVHVSPDSALVQWVQGLQDQQLLEVLHWLQGSEGRQWLQGLQGQQALDVLHSLQGPEGPQWLRGLPDQQLLEVVQWLQGPEVVQWLGGVQDQQVLKVLHWLQGPEGIQWLGGLQANQLLEVLHWLQGPEGLQWVQGLPG